jgi:hypothetical protein
MRIAHLPTDEGKLTDGTGVLNTMADAGLTNLP